MPRRPDPRSKTDQLILAPRNEHERMLIRGMREVFSREAIGKMQDELFSDLERILARHHYPPGNPQSLLETFGSELSLICVYCGKGGFKTLRKVTTPGGEMSVCKSCYEDLKFRRLIKK